MKRTSRLHELLGSLRPGARPLEGKSVYMHAVKSRHAAALTDVIRRLGGVSAQTGGENRAVAVMSLEDEVCLVTFKSN